MKNSFGLPESDLEYLINTIKQFPEIDKAVIFGSRAMGNFKKGSDVDIALLGKIKEETLLKISRNFNEESPLPYFFDVLIFENINNGDLKVHILKEGKT